MHPYVKLIWKFVFVIQCRNNWLTYKWEGGDRALAKTGITSLEPLKINNE
jgi:hypothetical protein